MASTARRRASISAAPSPQSEFARLLELMREDDDVVGLILTGSRGRGFCVRPDSDFDVRVVVRDEAFDACCEQYGTPHGSPVEVGISRLSSFERTGLPGSGSEWDRYSYVRAEIVLDKLEGGIRRLVARKERLAEGEGRERAGESLDDYINCYYRSARNAQNGLALEAHLDAVESVAPLLATVFALNGRVRPFNKFLAWELALEPLAGAAWSADRLLSRVREIVGTGAITVQQSLFRDAEELARQHGLGEIVDGWEPDVVWLRGD